MDPQDKQLYPSESNDLNDKELCCRCVGEKYLSDEIRTQGNRRKCAYCHKIGRCYDVGKMAGRIEKVFDQHYVRTSDEPSSWQYMMLKDKESDYEWERAGEPLVDAIRNAADMPETAAQDIQQLLDDRYGDFEADKLGEETEFSRRSYHEEKGTDDAAWQQDWDSFERSLKHEARFFSRTSAKQLAAIFEGLDKMLTGDGRSLVVDAGPGTTVTSLFRARVFQSNDNLRTALCRPDQHLGPPPSLLASAGRMNARGVAVFYGADDPKVALAEVRPPVGSQVAVAFFEIIRHIRLLDLTALGAVNRRGSIFDPEFAPRLERAMFLRSLSQRITKPVMPDDEAFEYLPTQAIADFLATEFEVPLDGIIFPSVQAEGNGLNVVLFHKASRVKAYEVPTGTETSASLGQFYEEGWETEYAVTEEVPPKIEAGDTDDAKGRSRGLAALEQMTLVSHDADVRGPTLKIDVDSIKVHIIRLVEVKTEDFDVRRHRFEKREPKF
jgi:hypothetical protein